MAAHMSKEEYLKRYLSGDDASTSKIKKKRKKKKPENEKIIPRSRIVDDDVDFHSLLPENIENTLEEDVGDNDPTVAEFIDERPEHVKRVEEYRKDDRWKIMGNSDDDDDFGVIKQVNQYDSKQRRQRNDSDSDQSPIRRMVDCESLPQRNKNDSDSDQSLPRKNRKDSDSDQSPPRRKRNVSDSDQSPPRRKRNVSDSDQSPPRRKRNGSDSDQSPPRRKRNDSNSDQSPPRRKRNDSDSDQSPPRRKRKYSDSDKSQQKKNKTDLSKTVKRKTSDKNTNSGNSPKHKNRNSDPDVPRKKLKSDNKSEAKPTKTLGGAKAGLSSAKEMREEAERMKKKEDTAFKKIGDSRLGKDAKTVFRDKSGKRRNLQEEHEKQDEEDSKKAEEIEKYKKWGQGLKQRQEQEKSLTEAVHEASKPMARYKNDHDLDDHLRNMERADDPMLAFIKKKKAKENTKPEKPKYKGPMPPPNRFNIMPGYRWDGVNRSNGFEAQIFAKAAEQKATKSLAYKWSVEEM
ncbi:hypothetical protein SNE40_015966 [Patella caerulea]|uniref:BUD13 homolog n=1 Tax=Patella caerulea TaxID=87958 RepID=A0AAN8JB25_PATCE